MKEKKQKEKKIYEKPVMIKHGQLRDITGQIGSPGGIGCTSGKCT